MYFSDENEIPKRNISVCTCLLSIAFLFYIGEKRLGGHPSSEKTRDPPPLEEGEIPPTQEEQEEEDVVELVTTTGDRDVVDPDPFTSESAQILIGGGHGV
ncbi:hypothetical protein AB205_0106280 [Aquarana catesbeiana]|uniref:Uncharacterized protein n=1 Tax=Aquarana catesbeiana TaxID=8400 RepID=A0A2G9Q424_AQUCT|nr:hypothetical protein AB205_0106280 [Aquarana catesbeiana]